MTFTGSGIFRNSGFSINSCYLRMFRAIIVLLQKTGFCIRLIRSSTVHDFHDPMNAIPTNTPTMDTTENQIRNSAKLNVNPIPCISLTITIAHNTHVCNPISITNIIIVIPLGSLCSILFLPFYFLTV